MIMHNDPQYINSLDPRNDITTVANDIQNSQQILELANRFYRDNFPEFMKKKDSIKATSDKEDFYFLNNAMTSTQSYERKSSDWQQNGYVHKIRKDFPILHRKVNGKSLVWLDNGATTQKPTGVINALSQYYSNYNSNIHRGAHTLANEATNAYEGARKKIGEFIGAGQSKEIIFTRGTTEAINLVAESYGQMDIHDGDEILVSIMEHHSNIVPWQKLQDEKGAVIKVIPINDIGEIKIEEYEKMFTPRTKLVAISHVSNVLGTINPIKTMIEIAHRHGARVLIDGAQAVPHLPVDVKNLDTDFYVLSGHKLYGPTGIGVLYGKTDLLEKMPPWQRGGGMIESVSFQSTTYHDIPYKFEAGTGNIADAIGLGAAIDYLRKIGMHSIEEHEKYLTRYAMERLNEIPGIRLIGTAPNKTSVLSFVINGISSEKVGQELNKEGVAVRSGHHCAQPVLNHFGLKNTVRASLGVYNTKEEVDCFVNTLLKIAKYYN
jgi:cysteine desulfurase/selenocysteine lyase